MKRGRKSASDLAVVPIGHKPPPEPPEELTRDQAEEWKAIAAKMPPGWFRREHHALLAAYCRHVVRARFLSTELDRFEPEWLQQEDGPKRYDKLAQAAERETRAMLACARAMRLTHQSRYDAAAAARQVYNNPDIRKPWDAEGTNERNKA